MAKGKKNRELWVVGGGKPPKQVKDRDEGARELTNRGGDSKILTVKDQTKKEEENK